MVRKSVILGFGALLGFTAFMAHPAWAVPSFTQQTGQACATCHVGAFGPQLTAFGRNFKLQGYVQSDGESHFPPLSAMLESSYTTTKVRQAGNAAEGFGPNNNFAIDQVSLFYAGRILSNFGAFIQTTYDGVNSALHWDNADLRYAQTGTVFGMDFVAGIMANNNPTSQDVWNSTPGWGFPYASSALAPKPSQVALLEGGLGQQVAGLGAYALWNDLVYLEFTGYTQLSRDTRTALGVTDAYGSDSYTGMIPYWRMAVQHNFGDHYVQAGTLGMIADRSPGGDNSFGHDRFTDVAFDANYQWTGSADHTVSAHTIFIHENVNLDASQALAGGALNGSNRLSTFKADATYSYKNTYTPSLQYFKRWGTNDPNYWGTASGDPDNEGFVIDLAYSPFGKSDSDLQWGNARVALQYTAYTKFDGTAKHASDNNTIYVNLWFATDLFAGYSPK